MNAGKEPQGQVRPWPAKRNLSWQLPILAAALAIGILLMAIQLWILTLMLDLVLQEQTSHLFELVLISGGIFAEIGRAHV